MPHGHHGGLSGLWGATVDVRVLSLAPWEAAVVPWGAAVMRASVGMEG